MNNGYLLLNESNFYILHQLTNTDFLIGYVLKNCNFLLPLSDVMVDLAGYHNVQIADHFDQTILDSCVKDSIANTNVFLHVPEDIRKTVELDMPNISKRREKLIKELNKITAMTSHAMYHVRTSSELQEQHSKQVKNSLN